MSFTICKNSKRRHRLAIQKVKSDPPADKGLLNASDKQPSFEGKS
ncbi:MULTISPECIES: hypothetical protein [Aeromonas]|jgi:hypothetical protein|nr:MULTISPECIES: hypothetical protein [Aeromonas]